VGINLYRNWWLLTVKAVLLIVFGLTILIRADQSFIFISFLAGLLISFGGAAISIGALSHIKYNYEWTWWLLEGLYDIVIGLLLLLRPGESTLVFIILLAAWTIISGILHFITAINIQYYLSNRIVLYFAGILAILFGIFLVCTTYLDFYKLINVIGLFAIVYGFTLFYISFRLKDVIVEEIDESEDLQMD
jgi:uncharacterized membrane protein HdeD (DUF308 family)